VLIYYIAKAYSPPKEITMDNGKGLISKEIKAFVAMRGIAVRPIRPYRLIANGKAEKFNDLIKQIFYVVSLHPDYEKKDIQAVLDQAIEVYNHRPNHIGYSPVYLGLGLRSSSPSTYSEEYTREPTEQEETANVADLVRMDVADREQACQAIRSGKAS
jgi:hypothetical protein